ncbi:MAG TPA: hypothetical protein VGE39_15795 [Prosthecobacter sp.]
MATRITADWVVQTGTAEFRNVGFELEDNFGDGNKTTRLALCLDVLSPVLFSLCRPHQPARSGYAYATRRDFAKRYKDTGPGPDEPDVEPGVVSRVTKEWVLKTGAADQRGIGYEVEDTKADGSPYGRRFKICLDVLSPVLYQLVKGHLPEGAAHVYAVRTRPVPRVGGEWPSAGEVAAANASAHAAGG